MAKSSNEKKLVLCCIGTRPEVIKMAPVVKALEKEPWANCRVLATAQHRELMDQMLEFFGIAADVDLDTMTVWVYEYLPQKGCLRLAAARTWRYDRYLENHNICDLPPDVVEQMIEEQRRYRLDGSEGQMP